MGMVQEFKEFAMRGNVMDLAVGVIIGGAFGKIVGSLVEDVIMPPLGLLIGGVDFSKLALTLQAAQGEVAAVTLNYGKFVQSLVDFTILAIAIFLMVKFMNNLKREEVAAPAPPAEPPAQEKLLGEIRDLLKAGR
jgi:large conductance mechanosensitive channel